MRNIWRAGVLCFLICLCLAGCGEKGTAIPVEQAEASIPSANETQDQETTEAKEENDKPESICVYVCGAVNSPGVYELPWGARIVQALQAAGGMLETADPVYLNQAQVLEDGQQVTVPTREETAQMPNSGTGGGNAQGGLAGVNSGNGQDSKVNINTADATALQTLTGIGEVRAQAILEYRDANGPFGSIEDLKKVDGIKDGVFQKIKDEIVAD